MLNLVMGVVYEPQYYNPLTEFLLERSVRNFNVVGQRLFWLLKGWMHWKVTYPKFFTIIHQMLMVGGSIREKIMVEMEVCQFFYKIADETFKTPESSRSETLQNRLNNRTFREVRIIFIFFFINFFNNIRKKFSYIFFSILYKYDQIVQLVLC